MEVYDEGVRGEKVVEEMGFVGFATAGGEVDLWEAVFHDFADDELGRVGTLVEVASEEVVSWGLNFGSEVRKRGDYVLALTTDSNIFDVLVGILFPVRFFDISQGGQSLVSRAYLANGRSKQCCSDKCCTVYDSLCGDCHVVFNSSATISSLLILVPLCEVVDFTHPIAPIPRRRGIIHDLNGTPRSRSTFNPVARHITARHCERPALV